MVVSVPKIWVEDGAILGLPVKILCQSDTGSLPINYTLRRNQEVVDRVEVQLPSQRAVFRVRISSAAEVSSFRCEAQNSPNRSEVSRHLDVTVVGKCGPDDPPTQLFFTSWTSPGSSRPPEPLTEATLTVVPDPADISEGDHLYLICGVKGTPPITFKWYRSDQEKAQNETTVNKNNTDFQIPVVSKEHSGWYHCEAFNQANTIHSQAVNIQGETLSVWRTLLMELRCSAQLLLPLVSSAFGSVEEGPDRRSVSAGGGGAAAALGSVLQIQER